MTVRCSCGRGSRASALLLLLLLQLQAIGTLGRDARKGLLAPRLDTDAGEQQGDGLRWPGAGLFGNLINKSQEAKDAGLSSIKSLEGKVLGGIFGGGTTTQPPEPLLPDKEEENAKADNGLDEAIVATTTTTTTDLLPMESFEYHPNEQPGQAECRDVDGGNLDMLGDSCQWYTAQGGLACGDFDHMHFWAMKMCCVCGGGSTRFIDDARMPPICTDTCSRANNQKCEDGGHRSVRSACPFGSDCSDCGPRLAQSKFVENLVFHVRVPWINVLRFNPLYDMGIQKASCCKLAKKLKYVLVMARDPTYTKADEEELKAAQGAINEQLGEDPSDEVQESLLELGARSNSTRGEALRALLGRLGRYRDGRARRGFLARKASLLSLFARQRTAARGQARAGRQGLSAPVGAASAGHSGPALDRVLETWEHYTVFVRKQTNCDLMGFSVDKGDGKIWDTRQSHTFLAGKWNYFYPESQVRNGDFLAKVCLNGFCQSRPDIEGMVAKLSFPGKCAVSTTDGRGYLRGTMQYMALAGVSEPEEVIKDRKDDLEAEMATLESGAAEYDNGEVQEEEEEEEESGEPEQEQVKAPTAPKEKFEKLEEPENEATTTKGPNDDYDYDY